MSVFKVRLGLAAIAAGLVLGQVIGSGAAQERAVVGETPNLAARLQAAAEPDAVVIADSTRRLVGNLFEYESLGEVEVKGLPTPMAAFRVLRESGVGSRFEALRTAETPPRFAERSRWRRPAAFRCGRRTNRRRRA